MRQALERLGTGPLFQLVANLPGQPKEIGRGLAPEVHVDHGDPVLATMIDHLIEQESLAHLFVARDQHRPQVRLAG